MADSEVTQFTQHWHESLYVFITYSYHNCKCLGMCTQKCNARFLVLIMVHNLAICRLEIDQRIKPKDKTKLHGFMYVAQMWLL